MARTKNQTAILKALQGAGRLTLEEIAIKAGIRLPSHCASRVMSVYMARLVDAGEVTRVKPGVFEITGFERKRLAADDPNQLKLL